jgi:hypothetical protein
VRKIAAARIRHQHINLTMLLLNHIIEMVDIGQFPMSPRTPTTLPLMACTALSSASWRRPVM